MRELFRKIWGKPHFIFFEVILIGALVSISSMSRQVATQADASEYLRLATAMSLQEFNFLGTFFQKSFMDIGYPLFLSILVRIFGNNIIMFQSFNFLFWLLAVIFVYKALSIITDKKTAFLGSLIMALSPTFLTFSAKLFSEPLASLGCGMVIYFLIKYKLARKYKDLAGLFFGMIIFFFTKTIYTLLIIPIIFFILPKITKKELLMAIFGTGVIVARLALSFFGGRSDFNLAIQSSKLRQSYNTIGACSVYYLSYPLGKYLLSGFEGACRQNNPEIGMPRYQENPYVLAGELRNGFGFGKWMQIIFANPIKYFTVMLSGMTTLIFVEGVYIDAVPNPNSVSAIVLVGTIKIFFASYIWLRFIRNFKFFAKKYLWYGLASAMPLIYFFVVVGNYPIEQRYFYPLLPWAYFYSALDKEGVLKMVKIFEH